MLKIPNPHDCGLPGQFSKWRDGQKEAIRVMITSQKRVVALSAPTGFGKCFAPGTLLLKNDGREILVEDIESGDKLLGPDSQTRTVDDTFRGTANMFDIYPTKGSPFVVTGDHILCVKITPNSKGEECRYEELSVLHYIRRSNWFKHRAKLYRARAIQFPLQPVPLDPYYIGLWLGDGHIGASDISTMDTEVVDYLYHLADLLGMRIAVSNSDGGCPDYGLRNRGAGHREATNPIHDALRELRIWDLKYVPHVYKYNSITTRLSVLAGLLDSDGHLVNRTDFEITLSSYILAKHTAFLARSVGLAAYMKSVWKGSQTGSTDLYYRVGISGNTDIIPTRIKRKQAKSRKQIKDVLCTGFKVGFRGLEKYCGFSIEESDKRFLLADFTVTHNSPAVVAAALMSGLPTCIVTNSKGLQDQYSKDFKSIGMVDLRGRSNYKCGLKPDYTCEEGHAYRCPMKGSISCPATQAEIRASLSSLVVTNYAKWTSVRKYGQGMSHFQQVIFDEGHDCPEALASAMQVILHYKEIEDTLKLSFPAGADAENMSVWKIWAAYARAEAEKAMYEALYKCNSDPDPKQSWIKQYYHMKLLTRRLLIISTCRAKDWVVDQTDYGYQFDPIRPARYAEAALLLKMEKIIIVSATLRPKTLNMIGISLRDADFKEFSSDFDRDRCPIYYIPTMRVDSKAKDLSMLWMRLDQIASRRRDRKGIVQTISYARRDEIVERSRWASSMIVNQRGEPTTPTLREFKASPPGAILVSPSFGTGYDFPMRDAEWQFLCKIPFPDGRSKILKARQQDDPEYGAYHAMQYMIQAFGRIIRSKEDQGENFIGDEHLDWFLPRYGHLAPKSFHGFFRRVDTLPPPPEALHD